MHVYSNIFILFFLLVGVLYCTFLNVGKDLSNGSILTCFCESVSSCSSGWLDAKVMFLRACRLWRWALVTRVQAHNELQRCAFSAWTRWQQLQQGEHGLRNISPPQEEKHRKEHRENSKFCNQILHCVSVFPHFSQMLENIAVVRAHN